MKRTPELRDLSDHHHQGLVQARRLRRAATGEETTASEATADAFLKFWQEATAAHFREEEEALLPVLARYGGDVGRGPVVEMLAQHAQIRGLVMKLSDEVRNGVVNPETLEGIGELLETHIRLEEREVFPMIEEVLPEEGLTERTVGSERGTLLRALARTGRQRGRWLRLAPNPALVPASDPLSRSAPLARCRLAGRVKTTAFSSRA